VWPTRRVRKSIPSRCSGVFADESTEAFASPDLAGRVRADELEARTRCGWFQAERAVRPMRVVVLDIDAQDVLELSAARD
jgi:hypothetical protein